MIDILYRMLIGSLLIVAIAVVWVFIVAIFIATAQQLRKRR